MKGIYLTILISILFLDGIFAQTVSPVATPPQPTIGADYAASSLHLSSSATYGRKAASVGGATWSAAFEGGAANLPAVSGFGVSVPMAVNSGVTFTKENVDIADPTAPVRRLPHNPGEPFDNPVGDIPLSLVLILATLFVVKKVKLNKRKSVD